MGILGVLLSIFVLGMVSTQTRNTHSQAVSTFAADLKTQQVKAMTGALVNGQPTLGYGIYFAGDSYVLFPGLDYVEGAEANLVVQLPGGVSFVDIGLAENKVVFDRVTGEVRGYVQDADYVELGGAGGEVTRIKLNRLGVITEGL